MFIQILSFIMLDGKNCNITIKKIKFYTQKRQNSDCFMLLQISCGAANNVACIIFRMLWRKTKKCSTIEFGSETKQNKINETIIYLPRTLTLRIHWIFPSGRGMALGKRIGTSYSPKADRGDGRCKFASSIDIESWLAT